MEMNKKGEYGLEEYTYYFSDPQYHLTGGKMIGGLKARICGQPYDDEHLDLCCRVQLATKEIEFISG